MSQALYTSMGGISAAQSWINVVSNNVANINTTGYKGTEVTFQDLFSTTMTAGNAPTVTTGGKNPVQVGLGVQVGAISRNFDSGTWISTGKSTDMMIQGNGFFSVRSSDGQMFLTKAGNFTFDSKGDLVTSQGYKVIGASSLNQTTSSELNVNVPQKINTDVSNNEKMYEVNLSDLNVAPVTAGTTTINITPVGGGADIPVTVDITGCNTMADVVNKFNGYAAQATTDSTTATTAATTAKGLADAATTAKNTAQATYNASGKTAADLATLNSVLAIQDPIITAQTKIYNDQTAIATTKTTEASAMANVQAICDATTDGTLQFKITDTTKAKALSFTAGTSNLVIAAQLGSAKIDAATNTYTSRVLDEKVDVEPSDSKTSTGQVVSVSSYTIAPDGSIEATYSNGDKLTIETAADKTFQWKYTTSTGVIIKDTANEQKVVVNKQVDQPGNFQLQMANVVNPEGLVSMGGNLFMTGPNAGDLTFTVGGALGVGALKAGGLESSNVDLSQQLSDMIVAQRAIQANSRVFSTTSSIMQTLVQLGQ